jgi:hypothetical protein
MNGNGHRPEPSNPHKVVKKPVGGREFTAGFYPGFARVIRVDGETLYDQKTDGPDPFVLPPGTDRPWPMSSLELRNGSGRRVTITIDDPDHVVGHLEVFLRDDAVDATSGGGVTGFQGGGTNVTVDNHPTICPPFC